MFALNETILFYIIMKENKKNIIRIKAMNDQWYRWDMDGEFLKSGCLTILIIPEFAQRGLLKFNYYVETKEEDPYDKERESTIGMLSLGYVLDNVYNEL
jgi:hypothetical protein